MKNGLLKKEFLAIVMNKKLLIPIIAVMFIPVLYSGVFLWAYWNPYGNLSKLPVAVVNQDKGAQFEGEDLHLGDDLVKKLKKSKDFNFKFVDKEEGYKNVKNQKDYMLIEIPKDFSENATTLLDKNPRKLELEYVPNESYNFLSAQIGGKAVEKIKSVVSEKITETYAETIFDKVGDLTDGVSKASDGAGKLNEGSLKLKDGSKQLNNGLAKLVEKSIEFNNGMKKANSGVNVVASGSMSLANALGQLHIGHSKLEAAAARLQTGSDQVARGISKSNQGLQSINGKMPEIIDGTKQLQGGATDIAEKLEQWQGKSQEAAAGAGKLNSGVLTLKSQLEPLLQSPLLTPEQKAALSAGLKQLEDGSAQLKAGNETLSGYAGQLSSGAAQLSGKLGELNEGQKKLHAGISQLADGSTQLENGAIHLAAGEKEFTTGMKTFGQKFGEAKTGADKLAGGSNQLSGGMKQLTSGSSAISSGAGKLASGSEKLKDGTSELSDGSKELADKLANGAKKASKVDANGKTYNMMADPVKLETERINKVPNYGTGMSPYLLSLGLFVGALMISIVFPLREPAEVPANGFNWFASKFALLAGIGVVQALLADAILLAGLGLHVESVPKFILFTMITSLTFISLVQFLVTLLGDPGRFLAIIILILQLSASAGTFPLELIPKFLQHFNAFLPMTYSIRGLKAVISSGDFGFMWKNIAVMLVYILAFALGTISYFNFKHKRQFRTLAD